MREQIENRVGPNRWSATGDPLCSSPIEGYKLFPQLWQWKTALLTYILVRVNPTMICSSIASESKQKQSLQNVWSWTLKNNSQSWAGRVVYDAGRQAHSHQGGLISTARQRWHPPRLPDPSLLQNCPHELWQMGSTFSHRFVSPPSSSGAPLCRQPLVACFPCLFCLSSLQHLLCISLSISVALLYHYFLVLYYILYLFIDCCCTVTQELPHCGI